MPDGAGALISALRALEAAVKELLALSYDKRRAIISGDTDRLTEISSAETRQITAVNAAERRRVAAMPDGATLDGAISEASAEDRAELARLKRGLAGEMRLLLDMNERSRRLLEERLNHTAECIDALTLPEEPEGDIYTADGRLRGGRDRGYYIGDA
ncbi:MAG: flagellar protein FlgN [Oscillospiraceae bacterium]|nr:flagellar protein FlgN [Oscillospiraceae bacterium]